MSNLDREMNEIMEEFLSDIEKQSGPYGKAEKAVNALMESFKAVSMFANIAQSHLNNTAEGRSHGTKIQNIVMAGQDAVNNALKYISILASKERPTPMSMDDLLVPPNNSRGGNKKKRPTKKRTTKRKPTKKRRT